MLLFLLPILLEIIDWSARYDPRTAADGAFVRRLRADRAGLAAEIRDGLGAGAGGKRAAGRGPPRRAPKVRATRRGRGGMEEAP